MPHLKDLNFFKAEDKYSTDPGASVSRSGADAGSMKTDKVTFWV